MLRVAIPYGSLNGEQMRQLAMIAERWDKGYGHFTTRQNIQFNWPKLPDIADILDALSDVDMLCDPDLGKHHSKRHCLPFCQRCSRRA